MNIFELFTKGGIAMVPLLILSIMALSTIIERIWFWSKILTREREIVGRVLESARREWGAARDIARRSFDQPVGRFLYSALELDDPDPEIFQLALQATGDEELAAMRKGEKILETVIAISPLLGLLGTVLGLIGSLGSIRLGDLNQSDTGGVTLGIAEALLSTATGLIIAIISLAFYRFFQGLVSGQAKVFRQAGNELELMYRKDWLKRQRLGAPHPLSSHEAIAPNSSHAERSESVSTTNNNHPIEASAEAEPPSESAEESGQSTSQTETEQPAN
ncbi:MAG: MotA/TolQ/ExbB proton channel family protein [Leptolyngbyaceae bacterium]|nr:MotA/TolQ/ExbB proton channel family protein [Leptolyngbyaceae bacterium]